MEIDHVESLPIAIPLEEPLRPDDNGVIPLSNEPDHGVRLDETAIEQFSEAD